MKKGEKYLITTDSWFFAPDGCQYKAVWGKVEILQDDFLGIKTNARSTNWYAKIGNDDNNVIVAGCQIHYAVKCNEKPNSGRAKSWSDEGGNYKEYERMSMIYLAE